MNCKGKHKGMDAVQQKCIIMITFNKAKVGRNGWVYSCFYLKPLFYFLLDWTLIYPVLLFISLKSSFSFILNFPLHFSFPSPACKPGGHACVSPSRKILKLDLVYTIQIGHQDRSWEVAVTSLILNTWPIECHLVNKNMRLTPYSQYTRLTSYSQYTRLTP